ncbi:MAG TPA: potassium-transporting ATPase subunit KdpA, partial [Moraxellaceae bacterium]
NAMHDSFTALGGMAPLWLMQLGEIVFGGVGAGFYGVMLYALLAVFVAGLMIGRTPEYLGRKLGQAEMRLVMIALILPSLLILGFSALAVLAQPGLAAISNPGAHGFTQILYAFSSATANNGSAFAGLGANTPFYNGLLGLCMWLGRFGVIVPVLAIAGSIVRKKRLPEGPGTLPTSTPQFALLLAVTILIVGALTFLPALALGPLAEQLTLLVQ